MSSQQTSKIVRGKNGRFQKLSASGEPVHATPHTDIILARDAQLSHKKAHVRPITLRSNAKAEPTKVRAGGKKQFSFPVALSQVRDHVYKKNKAVKQVKQVKKQSAKPASVYTTKHISPFVLDLKHRRTVVHHALPNLHTSKPRRTSSVAKTEQQGVLSLFEDLGSSGLPRAHGVRSWFPGLHGLFRGKSSINLLPRVKPVKTSVTVARTGVSFAWKWRAFKRLLGAPGQYFRRLRSQKRLQLQWGNTLATPSSFVAETTQSGRPIAGRKIHPLIRLRQSMAALRHTPASLSQLQAEPAVSSPTSWLRATAPFAGMCGVVVLAIMAISGFQQMRDYRRQVLGATDVALRDLQVAAGSAESFAFLPAAAQFENAAQSFKAAAAVIDNNASPVAKAAKFVPGVNGQVKAAQTLLNLGSDLSDAARAVSEGAAVFTDANHFLASQPLSYKLEYFFVRAGEAQPLIDSSVVTINELDLTLVPSDVSTQLESLRETLPAVSAQLHNLQLLREPLLTFLAHDHLQRHLVLFQNNTELRATGGFMGSFALVDMDRGQISDIEIPGGGPYDLQGSLRTFVQAPRALRLINPRWEFQDTNWFLDWPTSAATISSFYDKAGGPTVDSVIAIDTHVLAALLETLGPVELPAYGVGINADNFRTLLQEQVEVNYDRAENKPKKIIADLAPVLLARLKTLPADHALELAGVLSELLKERHIQIAHQNDDVQATFSQFGWGGEVVQTEGDYLAVVNTNLAGGKTDGVIQDAYDLAVHIDEAGQSTHTLTVRRTHTGTKGTAFTGVRNVDYLRVYVPAGSELVSATPSQLPPAELFEQPDATWNIDPNLAAGDATYRVHPDSNTEQYMESGKTVFAQWMQVDPGQTAEMTIVYRIPEALHSYTLPQREASWIDWVANQPVRPEQNVRVYSLYWQKQPGAWDPTLAVTVNHPQAWQAQPLEEGLITTGPGTVAMDAVQTTDAHIQLIFY